MNAANLLRKRIPVVMHRWDDRVRSEIPAARDQDQVVLRNSLVEMLEVMAKILAGETDPRTAARDLAFITGHGSERAEREVYTLEQMIEECQILQEVVFEEMEPVAQITGQERNVVFRYLGEVIRKAAGEFARVQTARARAAMESVRASEALLRKALSAETVGVLFFRLDGYLQGANDTFLRMSGYSLEELTEVEHWEQLTPPEFAAETNRAAEELAAHGRTAPYEKQILCKDGSRRWGLFAPTRLSGSGPDAECVEFIIDITHAKEAEAALRESEERYRTLFNSLDEGFCVIEVLFDAADQPVDYRFLEVNPAFERQTGLHNAVGKRMREMVPTIEPHWIETYGRIALTGESARFENGAVALGRWYDVYAFRVGEPAQRKVAIVFTDILPRKKAEKALQESEERQAFLLKLSDALRGSADPIEVQDQALGVLGRHLGASRVAYAEDAGDGETVVLTRNYTDGVPSIEGRYLYADYGEDLLREMRAGRAVIRPDIANDPLLSEAEKVAHATLQLGATLNVPLVKGGRLVAVFAVHYPTAHRFAPEELALVEEVAERTWAAVERAKAEAALRAADRAKGEFLAMLGHELRNPLGAAANALHLVQTHGRDVPSIHRPVQILQRQLAQMTRLVEDLLDVTRITQGRVKLEIRPVSLDEIVTAALRNLQGSIHRKGLRYRYEGDPHAVVNGDALRLEQVVSNLIGNAVKYTDVGSIHASVRVRNGEVVLRVRDTGIGIAPEALPYVFDLFAQVRTDLARTQGGLGIGLTVVKQIVEQHGGRVQVESEGMGHGSTITVTLPLGDEPPSDSPSEGTETVPSARPDQPLRVLVVDDNTDAALTLVDILTTWGHEARAVHDGTGAVRAVLTEEPDVALIDIGLPGLDGYDVARAIRQRLGSDCITLIAVTGYGQAEDRERALAAGFNHHVAKPVDLESIQTLLTRPHG